jgi:hypothetical protein
VGDATPRGEIRAVLEAVEAHPGLFDARRMARGEPGVPARFDWRGRTYVVAEVLEARREVENYSGGAKDGYVRRHAVRVRVESGEVMLLSASRGVGGAARWILRHVELPPP